APFVVISDASNIAVGGVVSQVQGGWEIPVAYYSRKLTPTERNYSATNRELLALILAARK
ncbi:MAG: RNase H-like domain-containing protein, partial [Pseudomonadota bacterium]